MLPAETLPGDLVLQESPRLGFWSRVEPSERLRQCACRGCETLFRPYRRIQKYCCDNCRKRAWVNRRRRRMAEHVARELLDSARIEEAIASFEE